MNIRKGQPYRFQVVGEKPADIWLSQTYEEANEDEGAIRVLRRLKFKFHKISLFKEVLFEEID